MVLAYQHLVSGNESAQRSALHYPVNRSNVAGIFGIVEDLCIHSIGGVFDVTTRNIGDREQPVNRGDRKK